MKSVSLSGSPRGGVGKKDAADLRKTGRVPGVLYGGKDQISFSVKDLDLHKIVYSPDTYQINLELEGKTYPGVIQELQFHPVSDKIQHVDLLALSEGREVKVSLPVRTFGSSPGVLSGGSLTINYRKVSVRGLPSKLPESISIDLGNLKVGDDVRVRDIEIPGCQILQPAASVIVAVKATRASIAGAAGATTEEA